MNRAIADFQMPIANLLNTLLVTNQSAIGNWHLAMNLFVSQGIDWIECRGLASGIVAKEDPHGSRKDY